MDCFVNGHDFEILRADKYTFSVLSRVLRGDCRRILTDHLRLIICHSCNLYPVWIWTPDGIAADEKERAWQTASSEFPLKDGYRYNLKYELAEYFIQRAHEAGEAAEIVTNMFAYDCPRPVEPLTAADGYLHTCTTDDVNEAAGMILAFRTEIADGVQTQEACIEKAREHISAGRFFFWKNGTGEAASCCTYHPDGMLGCVSSVYTKPDFRRKHYAQQMIYQVTEMIAEQGLMPMLYTDADYSASNACYEKIGYVLRGKLCTIATS